VTLKTRSTAEWVEALEAKKLWHAPVQDYAAIAEDPQVKHMEALVTVPGAGPTAAPITLVNHPLRYDGQAAEIRLPPQQLGAQSEEVLRELGFNAAEIGKLASEGVVRRPERENAPVAKRA
jgi:crotonobetainyl-CoA:carnitine CoA-transferase CaiB-like acyl-CoA transferase